VVAGVVAILLIMIGVVVVVVVVVLVVLLVREGLPLSRAASFMVWCPQPPPCTQRATLSKGRRRSPLFTVQQPQQQPLVIYHTP